jgi:hypothetical protein
MLAHQRARHRAGAAAAAFLPFDTEHHLPVLAGGWFGREQLWGDVFPHHWSVLTANRQLGTSGAVQSGRSATRAVERLGEFDEQAFGSADVAEEEGVLEVDDLPDRFPAGLTDAIDDATHVVDHEGDVPEPRPVRGRHQLLSACGRRVEAHHLEHVGAVGGASHHDLHLRVLETNDPIDPVAAEHPRLAAVEAEQRKKPDCLLQVLDDKTDVDEFGDAGAMAVQ